MKIQLNKKLLGLLVILVTVPSLLANLFLLEKDRKAEEAKAFIVTNVFDGDTFYLDNGQKIRLLNCNAPEMGFCSAEESKKRLEELILNKKVKIEWETTDDFGRGVAFVYQGKNFINKIMTQEGWVVYEGRKFEGSDEFVELAREARANGLGIYQEKCCQRENKENPDCLIKGNVSRDTGGKTYHFPGCSAYSTIIIEKFMGDEWFCSEKEAQDAGFTVSKNCYGKKYEVPAD